MREMSIATFRDVALLPEEYRCSDTLEPCYTNNEHSSHRGLAGIEDKNIEATSTFRNFAGEKMCQRIGGFSFDSRNPIFHL